MPNKIIQITNISWDPGENGRGEIPDTPEHISGYKAYWLDTGNEFTAEEYKKYDAKVLDALYAWYENPSSPFREIEVEIEIVEEAA